MVDPVPLDRWEAETKDLFGHTESSRISYSQALAGRMTKQSDLGREEIESRSRLHHYRGAAQPRDGAC